MSTNDSSTRARGVEQIRASLERITRDFDNMIGRMQMDNATIRMLSDRLPPLANRGRSKPGSAAIPAGWQSFIESQARQKAAGKELVAAASAFAQGLIQWAEQMKQRQQEQAREAAAKQPDANGLVTAEERASEAQKFAQLAEQYSQKARDEDQLAGPTAFLPDGVFPPDENDRHKQAAVEAREIAAEMKRRAYILANGTEDNYIKLVVDQYRLNDFFNNSNLNEIYAFYGKMFNDQAALNWLKLQHPAVPPTSEQIRQTVAWMALFPTFDKMSEQVGELALTGNGAEKSVFEKTTEIAEGKSDSSAKQPAAPGNPTRPDFTAVKWVREPSTIMKEGPASYQEGIPGSQYGMAPQLSAVDSSGTVTAKFDGVDASTGEKVDRKLNIGGGSGPLAIRQSRTAEANGFGVRWEVPNPKVQAAAQRMIAKLGIRNIRVVVVSR